MRPPRRDAEMIQPYDPVPDCPALFVPSSLSLPDLAATLGTPARGRIGHLPGVPQASGRGSESGRTSGLEAAARFR